MNTNATERDRNFNGPSGTMGREAAAVKEIGESSLQRRGLGLLHGTCVISSWGRAPAAVQSFPPWRHQVRSCLGIVKDDLAVGNGLLEQRLLQLERPEGERLGVTPWTRESEALAEDELPWQVEKVRKVRALLDNPSSCPWRLPRSL